MISISNGVFLLETDNTSYIFRVNESGHLEHLHYGTRVIGRNLGIQFSEYAAVLSQKRSNLNGNSIAYSKEYPQLGMDDIRLEISGGGTGDLRDPFAEIVFADGSRSIDFIYDRHEVIDGTPGLSTLPSAYDDTDRAETLAVTMKERYTGVELELRYSVFPECDAIVRGAVLINTATEALRINRLMSMQLDLEGTGYDFITFHGDWAREMQPERIAVCGGKVVSSARTGFSSNRANPFVMLAAPGTNENYGECIGCNLIYSGNHLESAEAGSMNKTRVLAGINPECFEWSLAQGERFETPEAVLTFSDCGFGGISRHMHAFVREHIVRGEWKKKPRPVLLNSWEAAYFDFDEAKLFKLAKEGQSVGIELFVMDDGWFGKRNNDTSSLGDWDVNTKKLPGGVKRLAEKINGLGMSFGIWVEPEMVNEDSELYRTHPEWAVRIPGRNHGEGRNQMLLDFTRKEVQDNIISQMRKVFSAGNVAYVKWDMNRNFSDAYSTALPAGQSGEFFHRYMLGLYRVMDILTKEFPHILFEGCASGGNRFDLGILCYMPQIWASDNTDAISRTYIQNGYSYGYPQSVVGAHVSGCPNHQTLRTTPLETRFAVASFGLLGYECNLCEMKKTELDAIRVQIALYKEWREVLQFGDFYRLDGYLALGTARFGTGGRRQEDIGRFGKGGNLAEWLVVSADKTRAVGMMIQENVSPHLSHNVFRTKGLDEERLYRFSGRDLKYDIRRFGDLINMVAPIHIKKDSLLHNTIARFVTMDGEHEECTAPGALLNNAGVELAQGFAGTGYGTDTRLYQDFDARMYFFEAVDNK